jgi:hypothetical protein
MSDETKTNPSRSKTTFITIAVIVLAIGFVGGVIALTTAYSRHANADKDCGQKGANHSVIIKNDKVDPDHTDGKRCDTMTITNRDDESRLLAFGLHEDHVPYDGVAERLLAKNQSLTITLNQTGSFRFHDHEHDEVQGTFTVR